MITDRYYYSRLSRQERQIYKALYQGVVNSDAGIPLYKTTSETIPDPEVIRRVFRAVARDNPHLFYVNQTLLETRQIGNKMTLVPQYFYSKDEIAACNAKIEAEVNRMITDLGLNRLPQPEAVHKVHDYFCRNIAYDTEAAEKGITPGTIHAYAAPGVFLEKRAVCEGISKALKLLLNAADIKCILVEGNSLPDNAPHAWNIIKVNNVPCHMDLTWDMTGGMEGITSYDYYCLSEADISRDHTDFSGVPVCNSDSENYFLKRGLEFYTPDQLRTYIRHGLKKKQTDFYFRYRGTGGIAPVMQEEIEFLQWQFPMHGMEGRIVSTMRETQGTGRIVLLS
ncbi:MAG: hypothetical protein LUE92_05710 [Clostridiales bacterium]|nr:hypothetical protein [Clostridiales bacterium]